MLGHHLLKHIEQFHVALAARERQVPNLTTTGQMRMRQPFRAEFLMPADWVKKHSRESADIESLAEAFCGERHRHRRPPDGPGPEVNGLKHHWEVPPS